MSDTNSEQIEYWNAKAGAVWVDQQAHLDQLLAPLSKAGLAAAEFSATETALDVGCGCGDTSLALAASQGTVTGLDISEPMLAHARTRAGSWWANLRKGISLSMLLTENKCVCRIPVP